MIKVLAPFLLLFALSEHAYSDSALTLHWQDKVKRWSFEELKSHPRLQTILLPNDPSRGGKPTQYRALATAELFLDPDFKTTNDRTVEVMALDGMTLSLSLQRLVNKSPKKAVAYLAVEPVGKPWHEFKPGLKTGPYFLFWINPQLSNVGVEEWPFQVTSLRVQKSLEETYPLIVPDGQLSRQHSVQKGFRIFVKNCFVCHTFNKQGASQLGPDLNHPHSPVDYFKKDYFRKYIRNPRQLRYWPESRMPSFGLDKLSEKDLADLLEYLEYMAKRRPQI